MDETTGPEVVVYSSGDDEEIILSAEEVRVLGVLVEKQITTPDYYPLSLNALVNGCNQTTSRDPVVQYDESTVSRALNRLREKKLAFVYSGADSRTLKYGHKLPERLELAPAETAALCLLMLRGPQTAGEVRNRSGRLHEFSTVADVESAFDALISRQPHALAARLPRQPGLKEARTAHLLSGPVIAEPVAASSSASAAGPLSSAATRVEQLETDVRQLRDELAELRQQFATFKKQFE
jgi:uncharacterized protein YceH (UPF0502 family)